MGMEQMGGFEDRKVLLGNQMQMGLASLHGEDVGDFIERHAEDFRKFVDTNPDILDKFEKEPEEVLRQVGEVIYH